MGAVLNRHTLEYDGSANTPAYPQRDWIINPDLSAVADVPRQYWKIEGDAVLEMTSEEKAAVDAAALPAVKAAKIAAIDRRTDELIDAGFVFEEKTFSLTQNAQIKWIGMVLGAAALNYPFTIPTLDGLDSLPLTDATHLQQLYAAAMAAVATHQGSGTALKAAVGAAQNAAEVAAVEDDR